MLPLLHVSERAHPRVCTVRAVLLALISILECSLLAAERKPAAADPRVFTEQIPLTASIFAKFPPLREVVARTPEGKEKRLLDAREWFSANGVTFTNPEGALYDPEAKVLTLKGTMAELDNASRCVMIIDEFDGVPTVQWKLTVSRVLKTIDSADDVPPLRNFEELKAFSDGKLVTLATLSATTVSGNQFEVTRDSRASNDVEVPPREKRKAGSVPSQSWPPPLGVERLWLAGEVMIEPGGMSVQLSVRARYAARANAQDPVLSTDCESHVSARTGDTLVLQTFTAKAPAEKGRLAVYAVLLTAEILEPDGSVRPRK